jgi:hypothetical protein
VAKGQNVKSRTVHALVSLGVREIMEGGTKTLSLVPFADFQGNSVLFHFRN